LGFAAEHPGCVLKPEALESYLKARIRSGEDLTCLVREHDLAAQGLRAMLPASFRWQIVSGLLLPAVALLAQEAQRQGQLQAPGELDACYVRRSDAELNWRS
jgi:hypothetical protein